MIQKAVEEERITVVAVKNRRLVARLRADLSLGRGEAEAIALALNEKAQRLGIDDKNGINACKLLSEHNQGKGSDWTAARRPVKLLWTEEHLTLSSARKRENQLKRWSHAKKAALVRGSPRLRSGQTQLHNR